MDIRTIVVGVDGSPASDTALDWAAAEAMRRGVPLEVLHTAPASVAAGSGHVDEAADEDVLDAAAARARASFPRISVITRSEHRDPASALIDRSTGAELVVVGAHGKGLLARVLLGSVSHRVVAHAQCPAVVVHREVGAPGLPVAVGVDGSPGAEAALALAVEEAVLRKVPLLVVHGWQAAPGGGFDTLPMAQEVFDAQHSLAPEVVEDAVARDRRGRGGSCRRCRRGRRRGCCRGRRDHRGLTPAPPRAVRPAPAGRHNLGRNADHGEAQHRRAP